MGTKRQLISLLNITIAALIMCFFVSNLYAQENCVTRNLDNEGYCRHPSDCEYINGTFRIDSTTLFEPYIGSDYHNMPGVVIYDMAKGARINLATNTAVPPLIFIAPEDGFYFIFRNDESSYRKLTPTCTESLCGLYMCGWMCVIDTQTCSPKPQNFSCGGLQFVKYQTLPFSWNYEVCCPCTGDGIVNAVGSFLVYKAGVTCDLQINSFSAVSETVDRNGSVNFTGDITSSKSFSWTVTINGETIGSGTSSSVSASWSLAGKNFKKGEPQRYTAILTVTPDDSQCPPVPKEANFTVSARDEDCKLEITADSSINIATGNLRHTQALFTIPNSRLMADFTLSYNSTDGYSGVLGTGWTHTYNIFLTAYPANDSYVVMNGKGGRISLYKNGSYYTSDIAVYPMLSKNADNTFTLTYKSGKVNIFNAQGKLTAISDENGNTVNLAYNPSGNLVNITDPSGKIIYLSYDANNRISSITDPNNNSYNFTYSGATLTAVSSQNALGTQTWQYTYDSKAFMLTKTDPQGNLVQYAYDSNYRVSQSVDPQGKIRNIQYDPANKTTTVTEKDGGIWVYKYDSTLGALTSKTDPAGGAITYEYDSNRNVISKIAADGSATTYTYDNNGNTTSTTDALGNKTTYTFNQQNLVTNITDATGKQTQYSYDAQGNIISTTDPSGAISQYTYDAKGNITTMTSPNGGITKMAYDQNNNLIAITDPSGQTTTQAYDSLGNMISQTDAAGNKTTFQYNGLNQLIAVTDSTGKTTQYTYDANGNKLTSTDANGNTTKYTYNYKNQLIQTIDALGNVTTFTYGTSGCPSCGGGTDKLTAVTDAKNQTTTYQYDQQGRLIKETDPLGNFTTYTYDAKGNMITKTKPDGRIINYVYDALNRLVARQYPNNTSDVFQYDQAGNVILATTNQNIAYYYSYDVNNRLTGVTDSNLREIKYQYDQSSNRTAMITPEGKTIKYEYNVSNQMTKITTDKGNYTFTYDSLSRRIKRTLPNHTFTTYAYDQLSRLTNITHKNAFNKVIDIVNYTYDNVGNRITKTMDEGAFAPQALNYSYDAIYRLTKAVPQTKDHQHKLPEEIIKHQTEAYSYDPVGNRQTGPQANDSYTYDAGNELSQDKNHQYVYDLNGNLISKTDALHNKGQIITTYAYDDENRLTNVKIQKGNKVKEISFTYDPFGRRISKTVKGHSPLGEPDFDDDHDKDNDKDGNHDKDRDRDRDKTGHKKNDYPKITYYVYDNQNIIAQYDQKGKLVASYIHGPNTDEPLSAEIHNDWIYYHADGLGSITALTNHMGNIIQRYEYDSFGNIKHNPQPRWITQPYTYTGREMDYETGLYYYRARYYDPKAGRFITKDPIGFDGGDYNLFVYVKSNPVNKVDPSGLLTQRCFRTMKIFGENSPFLLCPLCHEFIHLNADTYGFRPLDDKRFLYGPGHIDWNDGWDLNYLQHNGTCSEVECVDEDKLLNNINADINTPPYYKFFTFNCQTWAEGQLDRAKLGN